MKEALVLHGMNSPNVIKVMLMLEECDLAYEIRHVAVFKQEQFSPDFTNLNPLNKVPVLEDRQLGFPLAESGAILLWLAERESKFLPLAQPARAETMQWLMIQMANYGPMLGQLNHFTHVMNPGTHPYAESRYRAMAEKLYRILDERLAGREWLAGGLYSVADMAMQPWANYLERHGFDEASYPALVEWRDRIMRRPAVQRAHARLETEINGPVMRTIGEATLEDLDRFFGRHENMPKVDYALLRNNDQ